MEELELYDKVTLASGKEFSCDYLSAIPNGYMFIAVKGSDPGEIATYFTQPSETARIEYGEHVLENYIFVGFQKEAENQYKVMLRKAYVGEI